MSILDKLNEKIGSMQELRETDNVFELAEYFKETFRGKLGNSFLKADFDKSEYGNGILFIRYAKTNFNEATNETLMASPYHFVIAIEGFDSEGGLCDSCGDFRAEMLMSRLPDGVKNMRRAIRPSIHQVKDHVSKYFEMYNESMRVEEVEEIEEEGGEVPGTGTTVGGNPVTTGGLTSSKNVAVHKHLFADTKKKKKPIRRGRS